MNQKLKKAFRSEAVYEILLDKSIAASGPFDGGCLIFAKALIMIAGGTLVRITSDANDWQTEHYGAKIGEFIYDGDGRHKDGKSWINCFAKNEMITPSERERKLDYAEGYDSDSEIPDDAHASKLLASVLIKKGVQPSLLLQ